MLAVVGVFFPDESDSGSEGEESESTEAGGRGSREGSEEGDVLMEPMSLERPSAPKTLPAKK